MSEVIEKVTETVTREVNKVTHLKCDICGKIFTGPYLIANIHHNDWGNDSIDSYEDYDLCSETCVSVMFQKYMVDCRNSNTQYLSLEQNYFKERAYTKEV